MGRKKIAIKKIEDEKKRRVTFSKRREGLFKKAEDLAILTSSQVAVIIFSSTRKLFQYSSGSMTSLLKRYHDYQSSGQEIVNLLEAIVLKEESERLQLRMKHMLGEELLHLDMTALQELERQVEAGMSRIKARKNEFLAEKFVEIEKIAEIYKKDRHLEEENRILRNLLEATQSARDLVLPTLDSALTGGH